MGVLGKIRGSVHQAQESGQYPLCFLQEPIPVSDKPAEKRNGNIDHRGGFLQGEGNHALTAQPLADEWLRIRRGGAGRRKRIVVLEQKENFFLNAGAGQSKQAEGIFDTKQIDLFYLRAFSIILFILPS